jgi:microcystin-dependent protein
MLLPYTLSTVPSPLWVFPTGQKLSRTTYPAMWTQAQIEIANGNHWYNNGDGSTTFGIGDMRGRVPAMVDGGAGILSGFSLGATGGEQTHTLAASELPANIPNSATTTPSQSFTGGSTNATVVNGSGVTVPVGNIVPGFSTSVTINGSGGGAHNNVQPTIGCNYILFVGGAS